MVFRVFSIEQKSTKFPENHFLCKEFESRRKFSAGWKILFIDNMLKFCQNSPFFLHTNHWNFLWLSELSHIVGWTNRHKFCNCFWDDGSLALFYMKKSFENLNLGSNYILSRLPNYSLLSFSYKQNMPRLKSN